MLATIWSRESLLDGLCWRSTRSSTVVPLLRSSQGDCFSQVRRNVNVLIGRRRSIWLCVAGSNPFKRQRILHRSLLRATILTRELLAWWRGNTLVTIVSLVSMEGVKSSEVFTTDVAVMWTDVEVLIKEQSTARVST